MTDDEFRIWLDNLADKLERIVDEAPADHIEALRDVLRPIAALAECKLAMLQQRLRMRAR